MDSTHTFRNLDVHEYPHRLSFSLHKHSIVLIYRLTSYKLESSFQLESAKEVQVPN